MPRCSPSRGAAATGCARASPWPTSACRRAGRSLGRGRGAGGCAARGPRGAPGAEFVYAPLAIVRAPARPPAAGPREPRAARRLGAGATTRSCRRCTPPWPSSWRSPRTSPSQHCVRRADGAGGARHLGATHDAFRIGWPDTVEAALRLGRPEAAQSLLALVAEGLSQRPARPTSRPSCSAWGAGRGRRREARRARCRGGPAGCRGGFRVLALPLLGRALRARARGVAARARGTRAGAGAARRPAAASSGSARRRR